MRAFILLLLICVVVPYSVGYVIRYYNVKKQGMIVDSRTSEKEISYNEAIKAGVEYQINKKNFVRYTIKRSISVDTNGFKIVVRYDTLDTSYWTSNL